jgi:hypothetical protein
MRREPDGLQRKYEEESWTHNEKQMPTGWRTFIKHPIREFRADIIYPEASVRDIQWPRTAVIKP